MILFSGGRQYTYIHIQNDECEFCIMNTYEHNRMALSQWRIIDDDDDDDDDDDVVLFKLIVESNDDIVVVLMVKKICLDKKKKRWPSIQNVIPRLTLPRLALIRYNAVQLPYITLHCYVVYEG
ncbi:hypothetical protein DERF_013463 [Dermatophagoides farinae]|uniref:Uncharacterized protein n=1 Tax=Dermatophagoides farinae TaxID=6954 RepID=A0A922HPJ0_DERFA|nr:hypothetical protein DERF_013463 [Dermatophagoides farinae]